jgi:hypothetical protein
MARKTKQELNKEKAAKQKKIAIVAGVLFVVLLAVQGPKTMKLLKGRAPAEPVVATTTPNGTTTTTAAPADPNSLAAPTLAGSPTVATTTTSDTSGLVASVPLQVDPGQLQNFQRFVTKDPFAAQVSSNGKPVSGSSGSTSGPKSSGSTKGSGGKSSTPSTTVPITTTSPSSPPQPPPGAAVISLNGVLMSVPANTDFPLTSPLFHLISLTASTAKVAIAGGSYANGAPSLTLKLKTPLTLQNTADGSKYTLILEPPDTPVTSSSSTTPGSTTPTSTTSSAPSSPGSAVPSGSGG